MIDEEMTEVIADEGEGYTPTADTEISEHESTAEEIAEDQDAGAEVDYAALIEDDLRILRESFPELRGISQITELERPMRYAELRDLGLSAKEAYLATAERRHRADNRAHLSSAVPRGAGAPVGGMTRSELERARELFPNLGDNELQGLYKKVSI